MIIIIITILMNVCGTAISTPRLQRPEFAYFLPPSPLCLFFPLRSCRAAAQSFFFFTTRETASASMHPILICRGWGASGILWWLIETPDALNGSRGASAMESSAAYRSIAQRCAVAAAAAAAAARGSSWSSFRDDGDDDDDTQSPPPDQSSALHPALNVQRRSADTRLVGLFWCRRHPCGDGGGGMLAFVSLA